MPNEIRYNEQVWGEPIPGEMLSVNGYYTGEHKGSVLQDALEKDGSHAYSVENSTVHLGTITPDALEGSMPTVMSNEPQ